MLVARKKLRFRLREKMPEEKGAFFSEHVLTSLAGATDEELRLLILLAKESIDKDYLSESELFSAAEKSGIDKETFVEALAFFRGAGLVETEDKAEKKEPVAAVGGEEPILPVPKKRPHPASYTSVQLADAAQSREFNALVDYSSKALSRTFNSRDLSTLYSFVDSLCMPYDVIMLAIEHCVSEGKKSLGYVEKLLISFADSEIDTYEKAEDYIKRRVAYKGFEGGIRRLLGLGQRSLTAKEKAMISSWQTEFKSSDELITLAYERTVEKTGRASMSYMNKILKNWFEAGFVTVADVESGDKKPEVSAESSNLDEFFRIAVSRSGNMNKEQNS